MNATACQALRDIARVGRGWVSNRDIVDAGGRALAKATRTELVRAGLLHAVRRDSRGRPWMHQVTPAGRQALPAAVDAVRVAYKLAAPTPGEWVMLTALRHHLALMAREDVDAALLALVGKPGVHIVPESNQQALTPADRAAAVHIGGQDKHLIMIEETS